MTPLTIDHRVGADAVQPQDMPLFHRCGFDLAQTAHWSSPPPPGVAIIDTGLLHIWRPHVEVYHAKNDPTRIDLPGRIMAKIRAAAIERVEASADRDEVVGFYVQDDYIGHIPEVHRALLDIVAEYGRGRRVIMGFGCTLDMDKQGDGTYAPDYTSRERFERLELLNYLPGVDARPYLYSHGHAAGRSDFSMAGLMPFVLDRLAAVGWDPSVAKLIGGCECWEGEPPTAVQVAEQVEAFVRFGAQAICAFTWGTFTDGQPELRTSPQLRRGLMAGAATARAIWAAQS